MNLYPIQIQQGLDPAHLQRAAQLYFDAFRRQASPILGINEQAVAFIRRCINPQQALTAVFEDKLAGFVGLQYGDQSFLRLSLSQFVDRFGWMPGRIRFRQAVLFEQSVGAGDLRIESIAVDPAMRGQGVGTWLLNAATDFAGRQGFKAVHINVPDTASDLFKLCRRVGFNYVSTQTRNFLKPFNINNFVTLTKIISLPGAANVPLRAEQ
jgi:GNAT superfamily N-acetyltransferase